MTNRNEDQLIRRKELLSMLGIKSVNTFYKLLKTNNFPKGMRLNLVKLIILEF